MNYTICNVQTVKCPLAFVKAKQALLKDKTKVFLFDDDTSLYSFCRYLEKEQILYKKSKIESAIKIDLI